MTSTVWEIGSTDLPDLHVSLSVCEGMPQEELAGQLACIVRWVEQKPQKNIRASCARAIGYPSDHAESQGRRAVRDCQENKNVGGTRTAGMSANKIGNVFLWRRSANRTHKGARFSAGFRIGVGKMGKRGPKAGSGASRRLSGTERPDRSRDGLQVESGVPPLPEWLGPVAAKHWETIGPWLAANGLLSTGDGIALGLLCHALCDYLEARIAVEAAAEKEADKDREDRVGKFLHKTLSGNTIQHPAVGVMNKAWERVVKLLREFGLTPSARMGLRPGGGTPEDDPLLALMRRRQEHFARN